MKVPPPPAPADPARRRLLLAGAATLALRWLPSAHAAGTTARPHLGINLAPLRYRMSERPFENLALTAGRYVALGPDGAWNGGGELELDAEGWIRRLEPGQTAAFLLDLKPCHPDTVYEVSWEGPRDAIHIQHGRGTTFTKRTPEMRVMAHVSAPIRNVVVRERGASGGGIFAQPYVEECRRFDTLRFMDWLGTNRDRAVTWPARVTPRHATQGDGEVALEYLAQLCNLSSAAPWYCVHHRADDDFVRQAARLLKGTLRTGRPVYLEHSNEVWNGQFPQAQFCRRQPGGWLPYHIERTAQIARLFRAEGVEVVAVLGLQSVGWEQAAKAMARGLPKDIDATAIAPYFGGRVARREEIAQAVLAEGIDRVLAECRLDIGRRRDDIRRHRELAQKHGLRLLGYEGGQHLVTLGPQRRNERFVQLLIEANRNPGMYALYREYLAMWKTETDDSLLCLYYSAGTPSEIGSWGLREYEGQPPAEAPKYRAVLDALANRPLAV